MGQEILYCSTCRTQLRGIDFEKGKAHKGEGQVLCRTCYQAEYKTLPPKVEEAPPSTNTPARGTSSKSRSTRSIPIVAAPPPQDPPDPSGSATTWIVVGTAVVLLLLLLVFAGGRSRSISSTRAPDPAPEPRIVTIPAPSTSPPVARREPRDREPGDVPMPRSPERREEAARASLQNAIDSEKRLPPDFEASAALYEQALWDAKETPVYPEAKSRMDALRAKQRQAFVDELAPLSQRVRGWADQEQFGAALEALESSKVLHAAPSWKTLLDERREEVRGRIARAFAPLKDKALDARRQGRVEDVKAITAKVAAWGVASVRKELEEAVAAAAPPTPAADPGAAVEGYRSAWAAAMLSCTGREFLEAAKTVETAAATLQDKDLRAEATADVDLLRKTAALLAEALDQIAKWPKGRDLSLSYVDGAGARKDVKGAVVRADPLRVSLLKDKELVTADVGEIVASSLVELLSRRSGRNLPADAPGLALLCLSEADVDGARKVSAGTTLPPKYWSWGDGLRTSFEAPEAVQAETSARTLFAAADHDSGSFATQAQGVLKARSLLADFGKTRFVRRNRASIASRADEARDYLFLAEDLSGGGTLKLNRAKSGSMWTSDSDSEAPQRKNNFVDLDFSTLPDLKYRCWVYVGGCCAETLAFGVQGSEMTPDGVPMEPGADATAPVKHSIAASTKTHASHGGKKQPTHWGWVEIALPVYTSPAAKKVRIVTDQQGFSVGPAVVSATRSAPPAPTEVRDLERARGSRPAALSPGALSASLDKAEGSYDLSRLGTLDWAYWGRGKNFTAFDHKATGGLISKVVETGRTAHSGAFAADSRTVAWADGAPTPSGAGEHGYIWSNGPLNTGLSFSCPAGTTSHALLIYCGASNAAGTITAALSDNSAPPAIVTYDGPGTFLATITFKSGSPNQTLRVSLLKTGNNPGFTDGSIDLIAAMLR
jgi:hypothetical protein